MIPPPSSNWYRASQFIWCNQVLAIWSAFSLRILMLTRQSSFLCSVQENKWLCRLVSPLRFLHSTRDRHVRSDAASCWLLKVTNKLPPFDPFFSTVFSRDMHRVVCHGHRGLCKDMIPVDGTELLKYLRKVEFTGWFMMITYNFVLYVRASGRAAC